MRPAINELTNDSVVLKIMELLKVQGKTVAPHEKWTAVYSYVDKCRLIGGQDFSVNRTGLLQ